MFRNVMIAGLITIAGAAASASKADAQHPGYYQYHGPTFHHHTRADKWSARFARHSPWHGNYAYTQWGRPVALVVPPTANMKSNWSWGVAQSEIRPIHHRFARPYPGDGFDGTGMFSPTPFWPSHTDQFGIYYVRGPWE